MTSVSQSDTAIRSTQLYIDYAAAVDAHDARALERLVTDDVTITRGGERVSGREAFMGVYRRFWDSGLTLGRHYVSNVTARVEADKVLTRAYFQSVVFFDTETRVMFGRYRDVHVDVGGELKIAHKVLDVERVLSLPVATVGVVSPEW